MAGSVLGLITFAGALLVILLVAITGWATHRAWGPAPGGQREDEVYAWFAALAAGVLVVSWLGFTLVQAGRFSLPSLLLLLALYAVATLWWASRRAHAATRLKYDRSLLPALVLSLVAAVAIAGPFEWILGGRDPGIYISGGALIAQTGSALEEDGLAAAIPDSAAPSFFGKWDTDSYWRLGGFPFSDDSRRAVVAQFFHLFTTWTALLYTIGGVQLSLWATPLFGLLGALAAYVAGRVLLGSTAAILGALLLSLNVSQVWYSRYPTAEALSQFLFLSGVAFFALFVRSRHRYWGALAGIALGQLYLARVDMLLVPAVVVLVLGWEAWKGRLGREYLPFGAFHLVLLVQATVYALGPTIQYTRLAIGAPFESPTFITWAVLGLSGTSVITAASFAARKSLAVSILSTRRVLWLAALSIVVAALYAYFVRPGWLLPDLVPTAHLVSDYDGENLVRLGWYVSPLGVALGIVGYIRGLFRRLSVATAVFFLIAGAYTAVYTTRAMITPDHFWAIRRYVPVTVPCLLMLSGYAITELGRTRVWRVRGDLLAAGLYLVLLAFSLYSLRPVWPFVEMAGVTQQVEALSAAVDKDAVVLFEDADTGNYASVPLRYLYGHRDVFVLQPASIDHAQVREVIEGWWSLGRTVLFLASGTTMTLLPDNYSFEPLGSERIRFAQYEHRFDRLPTATEIVDLPMQLYRVGRPGDGASTPEQVDVGGLDYPYLRSGFYPTVEIADGTTMRWTKETAVLVLKGSQPEAIVLRLASGRIDDSETAEVTVFVDDLKAGRLEVKAGFHEYRLAVPASLEDDDGRLDVRLQSSVWELNKVKLGIQVDWVAFEGGAH